MKAIILIAFLGILVSLGSALVSLTRHGGSGDRGVIRALTWRIGLSMALFGFIMLAYWLGWVAPHGVAR